MKEIGQELKDESKRKGEHQTKETLKKKEKEVDNDRQVRRLIRKRSREKIKKR